MSIYYAELNENNKKSSQEDFMFPICLKFMKSEFSETQKQKLKQFEKSPFFRVSSEPVPSA